MDAINTPSSSDTEGAADFSNHPELLFTTLGLQPYEPIWQKMKTFVTERTDSSSDEVWLLEHEPVFTLGQAGRREHILNAQDIPIIQSDRGGQVTYHGPGQLVAYLMIDTHRRGWHSRHLVTQIEQALIDLLAELGITAQNRSDAPGVYTENGYKIASLGLRMKRKSSYHGLALNVDMDLNPFKRINPCGHEGMQMTQIRDYVPDITMQQATQLLKRVLSNRLNQTPA